MRNKLSIYDLYRSTGALVTAGVVVAFMNCSGQRAFRVSDQFSTELSSQSPTTNGTQASGNGSLTAYQDQQFDFTLSGASAGASYQSQGLPSWLTLNSATGHLTGTPTEIGTHADIKVTITKGNSHTVEGPYNISVVGDPLKKYQWHLQNTGQTAFAGLAGTVGEDIHLTETIRAGVTGKGIKVAVSDSGVFEKHRSLSPNLIPGASRNYSVNYATTKSWLGDSTPDTSVAEDAHGTAVAGLIAERGWLGIGARGVAPLASFAGFFYIPAQTVLAAGGYDTVAYLDQFQGDFDVFNYSWGSLQCVLLEEDSAYREKLLAGVNSLRGGKGALFVKAGGNEFSGALSDCYSGVSASAYYLGNANFSGSQSVPYIISVGALDANGKSASYSSPGANLWVSAPGGESGWNTPTDANAILRAPALVTTDFPGCSLGIKTFNSSHNTFDGGMDPNTNCEHTARMNGTSGATPVTTGAISLILSANPNLTWRDVKHILAATADKNHPDAAATAHPDSTQNLAGHTYEQGWVTNSAGYHFHNWYGFGRINVDKAVQMAKSYKSTLGVFRETNTGTTWKYNSGTFRLAVPPGSATGISRTFTVTEAWTIEAIQAEVSATGCIGNLGIELTSPAGTKSILMNINSQLLDTAMTSHIFLSDAFYGEPSAGTWTLKLIGGKAACATSWSSWQLNVMGH